MFEYKVATFEGAGGAAGLEKELNGLGEDGWRLVHVFERNPKVYFVFEKEKISSKSSVKP
jgi:hypothetical protein